MNDKSFYVWDKKNKEWCKAIWAKDTEEDSSRINQKNPDILPTTSAFHSKSWLWVFTTLGPWSQWWIQSAEYWHNKEDLEIPPTTPPCDEPGFWAYGMSGFTWVMLDDKRDGWYKRYFDYSDSYDYLIKEMKYSFPPNFKEVKMDKAEKLQAKVIEYCGLKGSRTKYLLRLHELDFFNKARTYEELELMLLKELDSDSSICESGRIAAEKALGLEREIVWVEKILQVAQIRALPANKVRMVPPASQWHKESTLDWSFHNGRTVLEGLKDSIFGDTEIRVWVAEEKD